MGQRKNLEASSQIDLNAFFGGQTNNFSRWKIFRADFFFFGIELRIMGTMSVCTEENCAQSNFD